jgi:hypothetical protein
MNDIGEVNFFLYTEKEHFVFNNQADMNYWCITIYIPHIKFMSHEYLCKECNSYSSHYCQLIKYKLCKYILFNILQSSFYPTHKKNVNYQGRIQDFWLGGEWVGEGSGDGPQLVQGRILIGGQGGEAPLKLWGF